MFNRRQPSQVIYEAVLDHGYVEATATTPDTVVLLLAKPAVSRAMAEWVLFNAGLLRVGDWHETAGDERPHLALNPMFLFAGEDVPA